jgi:aarF domain-containing kinase
LEAFHREMKEHIRNILEDASKIPKELIFIGRTMNWVRANNKQMGSKVNRVNIFAQYAAMVCKICNIEGIADFLMYP